MNGDVSLALDAIRDKNVESLRVLLDAGCMFPFGKLRRLSPTGEIGQTLLQNLVARRKDLQKLACQILPEHVLASLNLEEDRILDYKAGLVCAALESHKFIIPQPLRNCVAEYQPTTIWYEIVPIDVEAAEMLYCCGFHDVDCPSTFAITPVVRSTNFELLFWFIDKGANPLRPISSQGLPAFTYAWDPMWNRYWCWPNSIPPKLALRARELFSYGLQNRDKCNCACSLGGCTTTSFLLREGDIPWHEAWCSLDECLPFQFLKPIFEDDEDSFSQFVPGIIRSLTFTELELSHTCCKVDLLRHDYFFRPEEVTEIQEEEREVIEDLEELVEEFLLKWGEFGISIFDFMKGYWADRIDEYWKVKSQPDEEELQKIVDLGVVLKGE